MQLIFLDTLKEISGYHDIRSVRTWLANEFNIQLMKIGRRYAVDKNLFEKKLMKKYRITKQHYDYKPKSEVEKEFLSDLTHGLSEL